jgi:hypothetical protein
VIVTPYTNGMGRIDMTTSIDPMTDDDAAPSQEVIDFVARRAPELDPAEVARFMTEHAKPTDEPDSHVAWAVRVLRETGEGEVGDGLRVDRVVSEIRRRDR